MFSLPDSEELNKSFRREQEEWLKECGKAEVFIVGGGITALTAGLFLQEENVNTLVVNEAAQVGGRFLWQQGPVPVVNPAVELLAELEFVPELTAPYWIQRTELISFLVNQYFSAGGELLPGVNLEKFRSKNRVFEIDLLFNNQPLIYSGEDLIVTTAYTESVRFSEEGESSPESMVLNTERREAGWVQAGYQALVDTSGTEDLSLVNGCLLSGRKAGELILAE